MATQYIEIPLTPNGSSGNYIAGLMNKPVSGGETYDTITQAALATDGGWEGVEPKLLIQEGGGTGNWSRSSYVDIAVDIREYAMLNITESWISIDDAVYTFATNHPWTPVDVSFSGQRESVRGISRQLSNYHEIYQGGFGGTEYTTRRLASAISGYEDWQLNASGLAYVQSVKDKTYNPGWVFLSMLYGAQIDDTAPVGLSGRAESIDITGGSFWLGYDDTDISNIQIFNGPSEHRVISSQIAVSGAWKNVNGVEVAVGGAWKDVK